MNTSWIIIQILIGYNLVLPFLLYVYYLFQKKKNAGSVLKKCNYDYAIIVTAYEQTHLLPKVVNSLLDLNYDNYHIYIVADNCDISQLCISHTKVSIFKPEIVLASNTKSHFYAIERFHRNHEMLTIIDSDNFVHPEYINQLNVFVEEGFVAVQGFRKAKNLNTTLACLDSARDLYYNFFDGEVLFKLGSSSTLAGSGMAFKVEVYQECLGHLEISGAGFDKILQFHLLNRGYRIAFAPKAIVYDEKTSHAKQLVYQRSRWINTWFKYIGLGGKLFFNGILNKNFNQTLFGLILLRPPLFLFILLSLLCFCIDLFISPLLSLMWILAFILFIFGFFIALNKFNSPKIVYKSLIGIPGFISLQIISLYYSRVANKRSIATKH